MLRRYPDELLTIATPERVDILIEKNPLVGIKILNLLLRNIPENDNDRLISLHQSVLKALRLQESAIAKNQFLIEMMIYASGWKSNSEPSAWVSEIKEVATEKGFFKPGSTSYFKLHLKYAQSVNHKSGSSIPQYVEWALEAIKNLNTANGIEVYQSLMKVNDQEQLVRVIKHFMSTANDSGQKKPYIQAIDDLVLELLSSDNIQTKQKGLNIAKTMLDQFQHVPRDYEVFHKHLFLGLYHGLADGSASDLSKAVYNDYITAGKISARNPQFKRFILRASSVSIEGEDIIYGAEYVHTRVWA